MVKNKTNDNVKQARSQDFEIGGGGNFGYNLNNGREASTFFEISYI